MLRIGSQQVAALANIREPFRLSWDSIPHDEDFEPSNPVVDGVTRVLGVVFANGVHSLFARGTPQL